MNPLLSFLNSSYPPGPYRIDAQLETKGRRLAYRLSSPTGRFVVKVSEPGRSEAVMRTDVGVMVHLAAAGFPAPSPLPVPGGAHFLPFDDRFVYLYPYIEGRHPIPRADFYRRLGLLLARLHALPCGADLPSTFVPSAYRPAEVLPGVRDALLAVENPAQQEMAREAAAMIDAFPSFEGLPEGIIHTDPYLVNLLEDPDGELYLIDWDDGGVSYPLLDVGYVLAHLCTFTARDRELWNISGPPDGLHQRADWGQAFLEAYESVRPLSPLERLRLLDAVHFSFLVYLPNWGSTGLIEDNFRRMQMVDLSI